MRSAARPPSGDGPRFGVTAVTAQALGTAALTVTTRVVASGSCRRRGQSAIPRRDDDGRKSTFSS